LLDIQQKFCFFEHGRRKALSAGARVWAGFGSVIALDDGEPAREAGLWEDQGPDVEIPVRQRKKYKPTRVAPIRRRDLIQAAIKDISANGYDQVTVASVCETAGFSRGLVGHYFAGKNELLLEAVRSVAEAIRSAFREALSSAGQDPRARLRALSKASFTAPGFTPENVAVWVSLVGAAHWSPALAEIYRTIWVEYREGLARLIARAAPGDGVDPEIAALTFSQMVEGFWVGWAADPTSISPAKAEKCCLAYLDLILSGSPRPKSARHGASGR
jgi:AcrR family transcriptional regulator